MCKHPYKKVTYVGPEIEKIDNSRKGNKGNIRPSNHSREQIRIWSSTTFTKIV